MNYRFLLNFLCLVFFFNQGCSQVMVSQDFDKSTVFSHYTTYKLLERNENQETDIRTNNPFLHDRFHSAIVSEFNQKGYRYAENADIYVSYNYSISTKIQSNNFHSSVGLGYGRYGRYGGIGVRSGTDIYQYDQGMLIIDIINARNNTIIWRGKGTDMAATHPDPDKVTMQVSKIVAEVLKQFPPQP